VLTGSPTSAAGFPLAQPSVTRVPVIWMLVDPRRLIPVPEFSHRPEIRCEVRNRLTRGA
jgi:hypothetical protein